MPLILLIIGIILIVYSYRAIKKEETVKQENDSLNISFQSVLQDNKEEFNDYKMEIGILRRDIAESLTELQQEIVDIKKNLNKLKNNKKVYDNKEDLENEFFIDENEVGNDLLIDSDMKEGVISEITFSEKVDSDKTQKIKALLKEGLTEEQICYELSVSKGEVLLVKGLFKK